MPLLQIFAQLLLTYFAASLIVGVGYNIGRILVERMFGK